MQFCATAQTESTLAVLENEVGQGVEVLRMKDRLYTVVDASDDLAAGQVVARLRGGLKRTGYRPELALSHA